LPDAVEGDILSHVESAEVTEEIVSAVEDMANSEVSLEAESSEVVDVKPEVEPKPEPIEQLPEPQTPASDAVVEEPKEPEIATIKLDTVSVCPCLPFTHYLRRKRHTQLARGSSAGRISRLVKGV